ncbi:uncharacterized protein ACA1_158870 [Acanthamoeba castellanii str. Neff]|uniref:Uncharacterized protein n=1 Tax=Acanthamoeba castellanii (strain ATCC 30010 / Neff) TaxID=1257118 RepID=L8HCL0_ACACF|nr:uncharacterized protein ACA1_158870 [Acanthamoeba castellanii str. Neff]ELR22091.1 hypothetical protein ACA1_158870 [Acanthamoeba castellanii str. Neff]
MSRRKQVLWSLHNPDQFVIGSSDLRLYEISVNSEVQTCKCLAWSPDPTTPHLLAAGLPNGRVVLTSFRDSVSFSSVNSISKEFIPRNSRSCNALAWNPVYHNELAAGLGKVRCDFSTLVWDVNQSSGVADITGAEAIVRPMREVNMSEATVSLAWVPNQPSCLATGTGAKWLRIYDMRASDLTARKSVLAHSKAVHGVSFDPFNDKRLSTFSEDGTSKSLIQIEWCSTRSGILASIGKEESVLKLWDLNDSALDLPTDPTSGQQQELNLKYTRPCRTYEASEPISCISWHPTKEYRILTVTSSSFVEVVSLHESIPVSWAPYGDLSFAYGRQIIQGSTAVHPPGLSSSSAEQMLEQLDISFVMKQKALNGYSMDIEKNKKLSDAFGTQELKVCWSWLANANSKRKEKHSDFSGIVAILTGKDTTDLPTNITQREKAEGGFKTYYSPQRQAVLRLCGWDMESASLDDMLSVLEQQNQFERAAAIAVFHLDIRRAVLALKRAIAADSANEPFRLVAMALAGYEGAQQMMMAGGGTTGGGGVGSLWKETCASLKEQIGSAYLRAAFAFLCADSVPDFAEVLDQYDEMSLADRIAFGCRFLPGADLQRYITQSAAGAVKNGSLAGLMLTGLSPQGVDLLENYLNRTGDVQTACLVMAHVVPRVFRDQRVEHWMDCYRNLLDMWQLWHERALLDVARIATVSEPKPPGQVFARCNFCSQSLSMNMLSAKMGRGRGMAPQPKASSGKQKVSSCPSCGKPLPLCSICLLPLGCSTPVFSGSRNPSEKQLYWAEGGSKFEDWYTWCQTCRHGGHAAHLMDWFAHHVECPVTDCNCRCYSLDPLE